MSIYKAKHKARGRYGVLTPTNEWFNDFLGNKEQAQAKADELNRQPSLKKVAKVVKATTTVNSNVSQKIHLTLTDKGWISRGE